MSTISESSLVQLDMSPYSMFVVLSAYFPIVPLLDKFSIGPNVFPLSVLIFITELSSLICLPPCDYNTISVRVYPMLQKSVHKGKINCVMPSMEQVQDYQLNQLKLLPFQFRDLDFVPDQFPIKYIA